MSITSAGNTIGFQGCLKSVWKVDKIIVKQLNSKAPASAKVINSSKTITDTIPTEASEQALKAYPNPFINELLIELMTDKNTTAKIELVDLNGKLILECDKTLNTGQNIVRLYADVPSGTYILKSTIEKKVSTAKLIKL
jgi:Secretion system C-terminal sorting domain